jgi:ABC-type glycerol-3-phosphate transport system permease component
MKKEKTPKSKKSGSDIGVTVVAYILYTAFAFVCFYPFYYIFINSISANDLSERGRILFLPHGIHFTNYLKAMAIPGLLEATMVSVLRTVISTLLNVATSAFLGFMFTQPLFWKRKLWYRLTVAAMYFNAGIIPWFITMRNLHLTNNFLAYVLPYIIAPFAIILCKTFVESIPKELQEAAEMDGASIITVFIKVMIPVMLPIIATVAIFSAVVQWNAFQDTLLLMTDAKYNTLQFTLYRYINQASSLKSIMNSGAGYVASENLATAQTVTSVRLTVTIIVITPIMLVYPLFQRFFVKGIMIGAVKG